MTIYYGDFAEDGTVNIPFNTFDSNDPSASVTITNLADADIKVHKDGSLTQATTDGATVIINFDGITGNHLITIDTSADAFYVTGSEYQVRIEGTTVDAGTINAWVGCFSIERAGGTLALTKLIQAAVITNAAGGDISADILVVDNFVDGIESTLGTAGAGLTNINLPNQTMDITGDITGNLSGSVGSNIELGPAEVNAECDTAISDAALATAANLAIVDANVDQLELGIIFGTAATGTLSTTQATSDLTGFTDDQLIGRVIIFTAGPADGEATDITDYASASGLLTFTALTLAPEDGNAFKIV